MKSNMIDCHHVGDAMYVRLFETTFTDQSKVYKVYRVEIVNSADESSVNIELTVLTPEKAIAKVEQLVKTLVSITE